MELGLVIVFARINSDFPTSYLMLFFEIHPELHTSPSLESIIIIGRGWESLSDSFRHLCPGILAAFFLLGERVFELYGPLGHLDGPGEPVIVAISRIPCGLIIGAPMMLRIVSLFPHRLEILKYLESLLFKSLSPCHLFLLL